MISNESMSVPRVGRAHPPVPLVLAGSLSQKSETPKVVEFWMLVFARVTVLSAVFPPFSLHKTLESVCPASREPSQGTFETTSGREEGDTTTSPVRGFGLAILSRAFADQTSSPVVDPLWCDITPIQSRYP